VIGRLEKRCFDSRLLRDSGGQGCCGIRARKDQRPWQRQQTSRTGQTAAGLTTHRFTEAESACLYGSLRETASRRSESARERRRLSHCLPADGVDREPTCERAVVPRSRKLLAARRSRRVRANVIRAEGYPEALVREQPYFEAALTRRGGVSVRAESSFPAREREANERYRRRGELPRTTRNRKRL
jgi:hypothetical protein